MHHSERAVFDLRRGLPVLLAADDGDRVAYPLEGGGPLLEALRQTDRAPLSLVLRRARLEAMGLAAEGDARLAPRRDTSPSHDQLIAWATAERPLLDPELFEAPEAASIADRAALALMRRARLIPAAITGPVSPAIADWAERGPC